MTEKEEKTLGISQWLGFWTLTAKQPGSVPGWRTKNPTCHVGFWVLQPGAEQWVRILTTTVLNSVECSEAIMILTENNSLTALTETMTIYSSWISVS